MSVINLKFFSYFIVTHFKNGNICLLFKSYKEKMDKLQKSIKNFIKKNNKKNYQFNNINNIK